MTRSILSLSLILISLAGTFHSLAGQELSARYTPELPPAPPPQPPAGIAFEPQTHSPLDPDARIFMEEPAINSVFQLQNAIGDTFITIDADLQGFALGAKTRGHSPCVPGSAGYTIDTGKGNGQHIYVIVDRGPGRVVTQLPAPIPVANRNDSGPHTLRVFLSRSWEEGLKEPTVPQVSLTELHAIQTFYIGANTGTREFDSTRPLLTLTAPLDSTFTTYLPNQVMLDFHLTFRTFEDGYKLDVALLDSTDQELHRDTLTQWAPYCITGLSTPPSGRLHRYKLQLRMLNSAGSYISNGQRYDMNEVNQVFYVKPE